MDALSRRYLHRRQKGGGLLDPILGDPPKNDKPTSLSSAAPSSASPISSVPPPTSANVSPAPSSPPTSASNTNGPEATPPPQASQLTTTIEGRTVVVSAGRTSSSISALPSASASAAAAAGQTPFLENKVLSGITFTIVGVVGLFLVVFVATFFIRRRRSKQLVDEAVAFDPSTVSDYVDPEKARKSSTSVGHGSAGGNAPEIRHAAPIYDQYVPPVPYLPPAIQHGQSPYLNPAASQSQTGVAFVPPDSWGSPVPQGSQTNLTLNNISRPSSDDGNHRLQHQHHSSSRASSGEMKFAPTVPPDMRRFYDNK